MFSVMLLYRLLKGKFCEKELFLVLICNIYFRSQRSLSCKLLAVGIANYVWLMSVCFLNCSWINSSFGFLCYLVFKLCACSFGVVIISIIVNLWFNRLEMFRGLDRQLTCIKSHLTSLSNLQQFHPTPVEAPPLPVGGTHHRSIPKRLV